MSCDHCPFNSGDGKCWIAGIEQQDKEGWKRTWKKWMEAGKWTKRRNPLPYF